MSPLCDVSLFVLIISRLHAHAGILIIFGGLFSAAWALMGTINATYKLFLNKTQEQVPRWFYVVYYIISFGVPIASTAVALGAQKVQSHAILVSENLCTHDHARTTATHIDNV